MTRSKLTPVYIIVSGFVMVLAFQNCAKVGFKQADSLAFKNGVSGGNDLIDGTGSDPRDGGDDLGVGDRDHDGGKDGGKPDCDKTNDTDWLYIPGGRGHVPMSSVAVCPEGAKDAGSQKCPVFCFEGADYIMHKSDARYYFAKKFDEQADYGGGAVPGTCASPDLKTKK